jgi:hypothetical protein
MIPKAIGLMCKPQTRQRFPDRVPYPFLITFESSGSCPFSAPNASSSRLLGRMPVDDEVLKSRDVSLDISATRCTLRRFGFLVSIDPMASPLTKRQFSREHVTFLSLFMHTYSLSTH